MLALVSVRAWIEGGWVQGCAIGRGSSHVSRVGTGSFTSSRLLPYIRASLKTLEGLDSVDSYTSDQLTGCDRRHGGLTVCDKFL